MNNARLSRYKKTYCIHNILEVGSYIFELRYHSDVYKKRNEQKIEKFILSFAETSIEKIDILNMYQKIQSLCQNTIDEIRLDIYESVPGYYNILVSNIHVIKGKIMEYTSSYYRRSPDTLSVDATGRIQ